MGDPPSPDLLVPGQMFHHRLNFIHGLRETPSPDYVPGPEEPEQAPHKPSLLLMYRAVYPEYYIPGDDCSFSSGEQPLHVEHPASGPDLSHCTHWLTTRISIRDAVNPISIPPREEVERRGLFALTSPTTITTYSHNLLPLPQNTKSPTPR
ncbi:hypothetical protein Tco_0178240 [Tanacetum coccineum]